MLSTLVLPLPEELTLLGAGFWAQQGRLPLWAAFIAAWTAIVFGDTATFFLGRAFLPRLLESRLGRRLVSPALQRWAEGVVQRHGVRAIFLGRFLVALRGPVYLAIGASRYAALRFFVINSADALVEVGLVVYAGYAFGQSRGLAKKVQALDLVVATVLLVLLAAPFIAKRWVSRRVRS